MVSDADEGPPQSADIQPPDAASLRQQFPLACDTAGCTAAASSPVVVFAQKASVPISAHRGLNDFGFDDRLFQGSASALSSTESSASPSEWDGRNALARESPDALQVNHYQWFGNAVSHLKERVTRYRSCNLGQATGGLEALIHKLESHDGRICRDVCPSLQCSRTVAADGDGAPPPKRRVAVVTAVWDHVDGVSRTIQHVTRNLLVRGRWGRERHACSVRHATDDMRRGGLVQRMRFAEIVHVACCWGRATCRSLASNSDPARLRARHLSLSPALAHLLNPTAPILPTLFPPFRRPTATTPRCSSSPPT